MESIVGLPFSLPQSVRQSPVIIPYTAISEQAGRGKEMDATVRGLPSSMSAIFFGFLDAPPPCMQIHATSLTEL